MVDLEVSWSVEDGYLGGARPQYFTVNVDDFEGMSLEEIKNYLGEMIDEEFKVNISWSCKTDEFATQIVDALSKQ